MFFVCIFSGVSYSSPYLFLSTVEGRLFRGSIDEHTTG